MLETQTIERLARVEAAVKYRGLETPPRCREIIIRGVHYNLNLRELHDSLYGPPRADDIVHFVLAPDALILSRSPDLPALRTGIWPETEGGST